MSPTATALPCESRQADFDDDLAQHAKQLRKICAGCPVLVECREYAMTNDVGGFAGGLTERERRRDGATAGGELLNRGRVAA